MVSDTLPPRVHPRRLYIVASCGVAIAGGFALILLHRHFSSHPVARLLFLGLLAIIALIISFRILLGHQTVFTRAMQGPPHVSAPQESHRLHYSLVVTIALLIAISGGAVYFAELPITLLGVLLTTAFLGVLSFVIHFLRARLWRRSAPRMHRLVVTGVVLILLISAPYLASVLTHKVTTQNIGVLECYSSLRTLPMKLRCIDRHLLTATDVGICDVIQQENQKDINLSSRFSRDLCVAKVALSARDDSLCETVADLSLRHQCQSHFAVTH